MQRGTVYMNGKKAGVIERQDNGQYSFRYAGEYYIDTKMPAISLTLPKTQPEYVSDIMFPFFSGLLSEGINKEIQCRQLKIDENDDFTRLLKTAGRDTIGAITVEEEKDTDNEMPGVL